MPLKRLPFSPYHYTPSVHLCVTMVVLFSLSTTAHSIQAARSRLWYLFPTVGLCGILEILGWSARLWSSQNPYVVVPFQIQIIATILGPTPLLAASFVIFENIIDRLGAQYSRLGSRWYTIIFCTCDVASLVIQGVGGGRAAAAVGSGGDPKLGANIMLAGICFQLAVISIFGLACIEYFYRYAKNKPAHQIAFLVRGPSSPPTAHQLQKGRMTMSLQMMSTGLMFSTLLLFVRGVYRVAELGEGWGGRILRTEILFNVLDGTMVILAFITFNFLHPGRLLQPESLLYEGSAETENKAQ